MAQHWVAARPGGLEVFDLVSFDVPPPAVRGRSLMPLSARHIAANRPDKEVFISLGAIALSRRR